MKMTLEKDARAMKERFPTARAREAADRAVDELPVTEPMTRFVDVWLEAYRAAGGMEKKYR
jgi:hypothetical protein